MFTTLLANFSAVLKVMAIVGIGYFAIRRHLMKPEFLKDLSGFVIRITLPLFLFTKTYHQFDLSRIKLLYIIPLGMLSIIIIGGILAYLGTILLKIPFPKAKFFLATSSFSNTVYLPLALIIYIVPEEAKGDCIFMITSTSLVLTPLLWSLGVYLMRGSKSNGEKYHFNYKMLLTPHFIALILGYCFGYFKIRLGGCPEILPIPYLKETFVIFRDMILYGFEQIGNSTIPLSMFLLGGNLATFEPCETPLRKIEFFLILFIRLFLTPLCAFGIIYSFSFPYYIGLILLIESATPSASNFALISKHYNTYPNATAQILAMGYVLSIITLPAWITIYMKILS